jgi:orotidine-5'-phosphate decarboxylase
MFMAATSPLPTSPEERLIVALDVAGAKEAKRLLDALAGCVRWVKIGLQLFTAEGPSIVQLAKAKEFSVFLDLKFHDIPNTARHAVASAIKLGVGMTTLHTLGGPEMLEAAVQEASGSGLLLLGVTMLTSMDDSQCRAIGISPPLNEQVRDLARLAQRTGMGGIVASPLETSSLRKILGKSLRIVTPGIRPAGSAPGDQKRIMGPAEAIRAGADWIVVGRPITNASDPGAAAESILAQIREVCKL